MPDQAVKVGPPQCEQEGRSPQSASDISGPEQSCVGRKELGIDWLRRAFQPVSNIAGAFTDGSFVETVRNLFGQNKPGEAVVNVPRSADDKYVDATSRYPEQIATEYASRHGASRYQLAVAIALRGPAFIRRILDALGPEEKNNSANPLVQILSARARSGSGAEVPGTGPSKFLTGRKLAVIVGPEKPGTGYLLNANAQRFKRSHPVGDVVLLDYSNLTSSSLQQVDGVLVLVHGEPGKVGWRDKGADKNTALREIDGAELAKILLDAGLPLNTPVQFDSCNSGTDRDLDRPGNSVAASFAAVSQGPVLAARAHDDMKKYAITHEPYLETIPTTGPRLVTPSDFGAFVFPRDTNLKSKSLTGLAIIYPTMRGVDLSQLFPGALLMIPAPGVQASVGDIGSDVGPHSSAPVHPTDQPMTTWVSAGNFVIVSPNGAITPYEESGPAD